MTLELNQLKPVEFTTTHRVKFHEIDPYGHLSNIHYLTYYNENRWQGMREVLALSMKDVAGLPFAFYTKSISISYLRPIFGDEEFVIRSWVESVAESECSVRAELTKNNKVCSTFEMLLVCVNPKTGQRQQWDVEFMKKFFIA